MSEKEPSFKINFSDGKFEAKRDNTTLYRFFGQLAMYDHIFVVRDEESGVGDYVFGIHKTFEDAAQYMLENDYPAYLNLRQVAECDIRALDAHIHANADDLESGVPESWM